MSAALARVQLRLCSPGHALVLLFGGVPGDAAGSARRRTGVRTCWLASADPMRPSHLPADDAREATKTLPDEQMAALPLPGQVDFICGE